MRRPPLLSTRSGVIEMRDFNYDKVIRLAQEVASDAIRAKTLRSAGQEAQAKAAEEFTINEFKQLADELNFETKEIGV